MTKEYIGDGLYAESDGFGVWVRSENGIEVLNEVYFEPEVLAALLRYAASASARRCAASAARTTSSRGAGSTRATTVPALTLCPSRTGTTSRAPATRGASVASRSGGGTMRPYSRIHLVQGTKGLFQGYPHRAYSEGRGKLDQWQTAEELLADTFEGMVDGDTLMLTATYPRYTQQPDSTGITFRLDLIPQNLTGVRLPDGLPL